jgi:phytoene desaturase (3,4-didehydrolycopene-forming)
MFHKTFADLDTTLEAEGVHIVKCEPNYNMWFGDGEKFQLSTDLVLMKEQVEKWEGKDGYSRYLSFLREAHNHYELSVEHVLSRNFTSITSMLRPSFLSRVFELHPFESIYSRASKYFWTERLRRVFTFASMYMGMSPFDAPGTYSLLQYTELTEGIWYPIGGFHKVSAPMQAYTILVMLTTFLQVIDALVKVGERLGVEYRLSTPISKITLSRDKRRATGVVLANGETLTADVVVNNTDLVYAYNNFLPPTPYAESLANRETSCSSISFYWALDRKLPELNAHNIFLADEYKESFDSIFKKNLIPNEPSFYVNIPSRPDPTAAPEGKEAVVVLVPVGHLLGEHESPKSAATATDKDIQQSNADGKMTNSKSAKGIKPSETQDWPKMIALARKTILTTIAKRTGVDIEPLIVHEITNDPITWRESFNLDRGAILGLSHSFFNVLSFRPATRARRGGWFDGRLGGGVVGRIGELLFSGGSIERLYMVGASAHPGTGVPIVLAGGRLVAEQICQDLKVEIPWQTGPDKTERTGALDVVQTALTPEWLVYMLLALLVLALGIFLGKQT